MALLLWPSAPASAGEIRWAFALEAPHVAFVEIKTEAGEPITRFKVADERGWTRFGWRPDLDDRRGVVSGRVEAVLLPEGRYLIDLVLPERTLRQVLVVDGPEATASVKLPAGGDGVIAWTRDPELGNAAVAWAPDSDGDGQVELPIGPGQWDVYATGVGSLPGRFPPRDEGEIRLAPAPASPEGVEVAQETALLRAVLLPITALLLAVGLWAAWSILRLRGAWLAAGSSVLLAAVLCHQILADIQHTLPCRFPRNYKDPFDSVFFAASFKDSLLSLSDVTTQFAYPDGASWLGTGPAWLAYLMPGLLSHLWGPVAANNVVVVLLLAALGVSVWALAREVGAGPFTAVLAGGAALLSPLVLSEIDKASLDRLFLFPIPLFFLALHRAMRLEGWRWPVLAGIALAAVFYGQVYYGIYLAAACPLLVLARLAGEGGGRRLVKGLVTGAVAGALMLPGLHVLRTVTAGSSYDSQPLALLRGDAPLWPPVTADEANAYFQRYDMRLVTDPSLMDVSQQPNIPMQTPQDRLLAAANSGMFIEDYARPINHLPGEQYYWVFIALSLGVAVRRRAALLVTLDVALLIAYSLGPIVRSQAEALMIPTPYYLNLLFIPGFDQLKNLYRYRLMAATMCAVPMALGLEGVFERLSRLKLWRFKLPRVGLIELAAAAGLSYYLIAGSFQWPTPFTYTRSAVLEGIEPAPAVLLPVEATLDDPAAVMAVVNAGFPLVNEMPLEPLRRASGSARLFEELGLLNHLADLSGSRRPNQHMPLTDLASDLRWFTTHGVRYAIVFRRLVPGVEMVGQTTAFLDERFHKVGQDGSVAVWDLSRPLAQP